MIKNVIVICDHLSITGGTAKIAISSALGMARNTDLHVVFFGGTKPIDVDLSNNIETICLNQYSILEDPNRLRAMRQGVWNVKAEDNLKALLHNYSVTDTVVHIHGWTKVLSSSVISVSCKMGFKTFISLHDYFLYCPNGGFYNFKKQTLCKIKPMSLACIACNCDARSYIQKCWRIIRQIVQNKVVNRYKNIITFIAISDLSEHFLLKEFGKKIKIERLCNSVDYFSQLSFENNRDYYLFMGRLSPEKGPDLFCSAVTKLGFKGIVCGDGELIDMYKNKYPNILFAGWTNNAEKVKYISKTKCCIFPSRCYETFGLTVAEMLSLGIPCIVAKQNAAAEMIIDGKNGVLFDSGNIDSLISSLSLFEAHGVQYTKEKIASTFNSHKYSLDNHIKRLVEIYNT